MNNFEYDKALQDQKRLYTSSLPEVDSSLTEQVYDLVYEIQTSLINTYGRIPNPRDISIRSVTKGDKTYLVVEPTEEFKDRLRSMTFEETIQYLRDS